MTQLYSLVARPVFAGRVLVLFGLLLALLLSGRAHATVYYVNVARPDNTGDGRSWDTAKKDVQAAINLATVAGDEVWVKAGTYRPTQVPTTYPASVRYQAIYLFTADIKLYGGFAGSETAAAQRNPAANLTTLSADIDNNDGPTPTTTTTASNAYHVLVTNGRGSACVVDGFTLTGGRADGPSFAPKMNVGAGMSNLFSSPTVSNCVFSANTASSGGGMYNENSSPTVSQCTFSGNTASLGGGGMYLFANSSPTVSSCTFTGNTTGIRGNGAGIGSNLGNLGSLKASNCVFSGNTSGGASSGGGVSISGTGNSNSTVSGCVFSGNTVTSGNSGGMSISGSNSTVSNCVFSSNTVTSGNSGGMSISGDNAKVNNCVFSSNTITGGNGGGMSISNSFNPTVSGCTFSGNTAMGTSSLGGGLYSAAATGGTLTNCILYQNTTPNNNNDLNREELYKVDATNVLTVSHCIVRDAAGTAPNLTVLNATLSNCYTEAPGYVDAANPIGSDGLWATADDGLRLACGSFAVDLGTGTTPATDLLGNPRLRALDLGAYEVAGSSAPSNNLPAATTTVLGVQTAVSLPYSDCVNQLLQLNAAGAYTLRGRTVVTVFVQATAPTYNRQPYVRRYYDLAPAANAATATAELTLYFTQADFADYNAARAGRPALPTSAADPEGYAANLRLTQFHGTSATGAPGSYTGWAGAGPAKVFITPTAVTYNAAATRWEVRFPVTGFSGFFAHTGSAPLPVALTAFTATAEGPAAVRLAWATATEQNSARFEVERSLDGRTFAGIGTVAAAGTSSSARAYEWLDARRPASASALYYRLRQVDVDGTFSYSPVRTVALSGPAASRLVLAPNPARATTVTGAAAGAPVTVFDAVGRAVLAATANAAGAAALVLPAHLPAGVYVVRTGTQAVRLVVE
ncbi:right-handed parallel beta-helix repeat-containing protein [Hymenobacter sp. BT683]|uniref:Right-handed parallel beta-helix repeat-containing protein n=1 Tax=Hymenobacter jeongseonensis TaxID=2791027 RepID=A0ABS0IE14_9BACT|nr:right-handed parallel beta-helix repeat-containing protein [Hymenobacter jeongseonensis]MBF9236105.1 right-handed parallel beta-helix repeat-containing protein [Hymenobacter jeongseonensis]